MLGDLVSGRERSSVVCIEDTVELSGLQLLCSFVKSLLKRLDKVHILCFEPPSQLLNPCERLLIHDGFSDTFGWLGTPSCLNVNSDIEKYLSDQSQRSGQASANQRSAVVIDTLTPLITQHGAVKSCQIVQNLCKAKLKGGNIAQVVFLLHGDLHSDHSLTLIHHVTSSVLKICPSKSPNHAAICNILHKKPSGKVIKLSEHFDVNSSLDVQNVEEWKPSNAMATDVSESQLDPTANLTFNLSLTDEEKQARSKLVLPYTKAMDRPVIGTDNTSGGGEGGKIFYQPDEADDFDEEDPDDDLDI
ncbi:elongator complex protein 5-like [Liolophura sinensis]|uniref:elongator complex protein 5-like n=1 Tax=Liolophura sinensis TaxID=3198878 RepID=UPI0031584EF2